MDIGAFETRSRQSLRLAGGVEDFAPSGFTHLHEHRGILKRGWQHDARISSRKQIFFDYPIILNTVSFSQIEKLISGTGALVMGRTTQLPSLSGMACRR
jgi:hypothetical protein